MKRGFQEKNTIFNEDSKEYYPFKLEEEKTLGVVLKKIPEFIEIVEFQIRTSASKSQVLLKCVGFSPRHKPQALIEAQVKTTRPCRIKM